MKTPWGTADNVETIRPGILCVSTSSHGGFFVSDERLTIVRKKFPKFKTFCGKPNWFEEDCDAVIVVLSFPDFFSNGLVESAQQQYDSGKSYYEKI